MSQALQTQMALMLQILYISKVSDASSPGYVSKLTKFDPFTLYFYHTDAYTVKKLYILIRLIQSSQLAQVDFAIITTYVAYLLNQLYQASIQANVTDHQ